MENHERGAPHLLCAHSGPADPAAGVLEEDLPPGPVRPVGPGAGPAADPGEPAGGGLQCPHRGGPGGGGPGGPVGLPPAHL